MVYVSVFFSSLYLMLITMLQLTMFLKTTVPFTYFGNINH